MEYVKATQRLNRSICIATRLFSCQRTRPNACASSRMLPRTPRHRKRPSRDRHRVGGGKRARTADPLLAKQVLFQLSYTPAALTNPRVVGLGRFELPTSRLSGVRSDQLSYRPLPRQIRWSSGFGRLVRSPAKPSVVPMFAQN